MWVGVGAASATAGPVSSVYSAAQSACQALRQGSCSSDPGWRFQRVAASGNQYDILVPSTVGGAYPGCIQVNPKPNGYPGAIFTEVLCNSSASQVLTLTTAP